jgi:hypothetical protein
MRRETGVWLLATGLETTEASRSTRETQSCAAGNVRVWTVGALVSPACATEERVGPRKSPRAESDLAVGQDENMGRASSGLYLSRVRGRMLHAGDYGLKSLASLPN